MVTKGRLNEIQKDFSIVIEKKKIMGILIYGSNVKGLETNKSDIDTCIVAPNEDNFELLSFIAGNINVIKKKNDVRTFSELPLEKIWTNVLF